MRRGVNRDYVVTAQPEGFLHDVLGYSWGFLNKRLSHRRIPFSSLGGLISIIVHLRSDSSESAGDSGGWNPNGLSSGGGLILFFS